MDAIKFPVDATWVPGKHVGSQVLEDPYGNRLIKKSEYGSRAFYWCGRKDLNCPVRVTLNKDTNQLLGARNKHNHDSAKLIQFIKGRKDEIIENAVVRNPTAFKDLANSLLSSPTKSPGVGCLPKQSTLARTIQRKRKLNLGVAGNLPSDWDEYVSDNFGQSTVHNS